MNHAPQAGLEGGALQYEAAGDGHYNDGDKPGTLPEMVPKVTDEEELGDETLLDPAEVAKTLPPWYQQVWYEVRLWQGALSRSQSLLVRYTATL